MTPNEYRSGLNRLETIYPDHRSLSAIRRGYSMLNCRLLSKALDSAPNPVQEIVVTRHVSKEVVTEETNPLQDEINNLYDEIAKLKGRRAQKSNHFHKCTSDRQRKENSYQIIVIQSNIKKAYEDIKYIKLHRELPAKETDDLPVDPIKLVGKLNSVRSSISRVKGYLNVLALKPYEGTTIKRIQKHEAKLKALELTKKNVEKAIEDKTVH